MAHERLSPRQKMIGMMYLILTAMLALNVSKEAVEAFKKVDKSLTTTLANYIKKNNLIYEEFTRAAAERRMPFFIQPARKPCSNATGTDEFKVCSQVFWLSRLAAAFPNQKISSVA